MSEVKPKTKKRKKRKRRKTAWQKILEKDLELTEHSLVQTRLQNVMTERAFELEAKRSKNKSGCVV